VRIDFDDIWQKYAKGSKIEFAGFSFHVGLHFMNFSIFIFLTGHWKSRESWRCIKRANFDRCKFL